MAELQRLSRKRCQVYSQQAPFMMGRIPTEQVLSTTIPGPKTEGHMLEGNIDLLMHSSYICCVSKAWLLTR